MGTPPKSVNEAVNKVLKDRHDAMQELKEQLKRAQDRMKKMADRKRSERKFQEGDWVYLKLQPYRQLTVHNSHKQQKLRPKYYGPFEILKKVGTVAYELNLPKGSLVHPVFHVSQLKGRVSKEVPLMPNLPIMGPENKVRIEPLEIIDRRLIKRGNEGVPQLLVRWSNLADEEATWEDYDTICKQFPNFVLEDKFSLKGKGVSAMVHSNLGVTVGGRIEQIKLGKEQEKGERVVVSGLGLNGLLTNSIDKETASQASGSREVRDIPFSSSKGDRDTIGDHEGWRCMLTSENGLENEY